MERQFDLSVSFMLDPVADTVIDGAGRVIRLTRAEFRLLHVLMVHAGRVLTPQLLLRAAWGYLDNTGTRNLLAAYIRHLRRKIEPDAQHPQHIVTVRGQGYTFRH